MVCSISLAYRGWFELLRSVDNDSCSCRVRNHTSSGASNLVALEKSLCYDLSCILFFKRVFNCEGNIYSGAQLARDEAAHGCDQECLSVLDEVFPFVVDLLHSHAVAKRLDELRPESIDDRAA